MRSLPDRAPIIAGVAVAVAVLGGIGAVGWNFAGGQPPVEAKSMPKVQGPKSEVQRAADQPAWLPVALAGDLRPISASETVRSTRQPAHVEPYERTMIYAKAAGFVSSVRVDLGSRVKAGDVLAELWIPEMEQDLAQKQALVEEAAAAVGQTEAAIVAAESVIIAAAAKVKESRAEIQRYQAEAEFRTSEHRRFTDLVDRRAVEQALLDERLKQLHSANAAVAAAEAGLASAEANELVEQARLKQAQANLTVAQARLRVAQANLQHVAVLIDYAVIRAPYDGIVTERGIDTGDFARSATNGASEPLFTVMRETPLRIVVDIPESDAGWVRPGLPAMLSVDGIKDHHCACVVKRVAEMLDPRTHAMRVEVEVTERVEGLRPGMYGAVTITDAPPSQPIGVGAAASLGTRASN